MAKIQVRPLGWLARLADVLMVPVMYIVSGTLNESPQRTHRWNNKKLSHGEVAHLSQKAMVQCSGISTARTRFLSFIPLFHVPVLGGWRRYVVLVPESNLYRRWLVGWIAEDARGVTCLPLRGPVRMLLGPKDVAFFAIDVESGEQIVLTKIAKGIVGQGGPYAHVPLL